MNESGGWMVCERKNAWKLQFPWLKGLKKFREMNESGGLAWKASKIREILLSLVSPDRSPNKDHYACQIEAKCLLDRSPKRGQIEDKNSTSSGPNVRHIKVQIEVRLRAARSEPKSRPNWALEWWMRTDEKITWKQSFRPNAVTEDWRKRFHVCMWKL